MLLVIEDNQGDLRTITNEEMNKKEIVELLKI